MLSKRDHSENQSQHFTFTEKAEIYLKSMIYGFSNNAEFGLVAAACGWITGSVLGSIWSIPSCPDPIAIESCFTSTTTIMTATGAAVVAGITAMSCTSIPVVRQSIDEA